tara:strand:- start:237 stop:530 length:294 start_codon:yes stop_codon:yes gene_type:complete
MAMAYDWQMTEPRTKGDIHIPGKQVYMDKVDIPFAKLTCGGAGPSPELQRVAQRTAMRLAVDDLHINCPQFLDKRTVVCRKDDGPEAAPVKRAHQVE